MTLLLSTPSLAHAADLVSPSGLGNVKFGMTTGQAERALGAKLDLSNAEDPSGHCLRGSRADGVDPGVIYMVIDGVVQRVDVELSNSPSVRTAEGIGDNATPATVRSIYGARLRANHSDFSGADDLEVQASNGKAGLKFVFEHGALRWILAGNYPALARPEGCL